MNPVSNFLIKSDNLLDKSLVLNPLNNFVDLVIKGVVLNILKAVNKNTVESNHYFKHLDQKSYLRCLTLLIPILGNIIVAIYDHRRSTKPLELTGKANTDQTPLEVQGEVLNSALPPKELEGRVGVVGEWQRRLADRDMIVRHVYPGGRQMTQEISKGDGYYTLKGVIQIGYRGSYDPPKDMTDE